MKCHYRACSRLQKILVLVLIACAVSLPCRAQEPGEVRGVVIDADSREPLPIAHLRIVGTRLGTISNENGEFTLKIERLPAEITVSYIGYHSETVRIDGDSPDTITVELVPNPVMLEPVVVYSEDLAARIMRKVIEKKQAWRKTLETYQADAYTRVNLKRIVKIVSIAESASTVYWDAEQGSKEVISARRQTKNTERKNNFASARMLPNLYDDDIDILGFSVIGPTHPDALDHYEFSIAGKRRMDDKTVYDISLTPKSKLQPSFVGTISVLDGDFAMIAADVKPNEAIMFPPPLKKFTFSVEQQFSNFGGDYWLPVDVRVGGSIKIELPGLDFPTIAYSQLTRLSDYKVNVALPDSLFKSRETTVVTISNDTLSVERKRVTSGDNAVESDEPPSVDAARSRVKDAPAATENETGDTVRIPEGGEQPETVDESSGAVQVADGAVNDDSSTPVEQDADEPEEHGPGENDGAPKETADEHVPALSDSLFAERAGAVPLTGEEQAAYDSIDSTMTIDKAFKPKGVLARLIKTDDKKKNGKENGESSNLKKAFSKVFSGFTPHLRHNRVEGFHMGGEFRKKIDRPTTVWFRGGYNDGPGDWSYGAKVNRVWGKNNRGFVSLEGGDEILPRFESDTYAPWMTSTMTLAGRPDYFDFYRSEHIGVSAGYRIRRIRTLVSTRFGLERHASLEKTTDFSLFGDPARQRENPAVDAGRLVSAGASLSWGDTYVPFGITGVKHADLSVEYSDPGLFGSDFSFTAVEGTLNWKIDTFLKRRLLPMSLDLRLVGGASFGDPPPQRFGSLDGSLMAFTPFGTFRTLRNGHLEGEHHCALFLEHNFRTVPFELVGLRLLAERGIGIILHGAAGRTWISGERLDGMDYRPPYRDGMTSEIGFSINGLFGFWRLDMTKRLHTGGGTVGFGATRFL